VHIYTYVHTSNELQVNPSVCAKGKECWHGDHWNVQCDSSLPLRYAVWLMRDTSLNLPFYLYKIGIVAMVASLKQFSQPQSQITNDLFNVSSWQWCSCTCNFPWARDVSRRNKLMAVIRLTHNAKPLMAVPLTRPITEKVIKLVLARSIGLWLADDWRIFVDRILLVVRSLLEPFRVVTRICVLTSGFQQHRHQDERIHFLSLCTLSLLHFVRRNQGQPCWPLNLNPWFLARSGAVQRITSQNLDEWGVELNQFDQQYLSNLLMKEI
jgi:hypothetical protein